MHHPREVVVDPSISPAFYWSSMEQALVSGRIPGKFHYDSPAKTLAWMELHKAFSPAIQDPGTRNLYSTAFATVCAQFRGQESDFLSLCPGSASKEVTLLDALNKVSTVCGIKVLEFSLPLLLDSMEEFAKLNAFVRPRGFLGDFLETKRTSLDAADSSTERPVLASLFGIVHNFPHAEVFPHLARFFRSSEQVLVGINGVASRGTADHLDSIRVQYDNPPTTRWVSRFLIELGLDPGVGKFQTVVRHSSNDMEPSSISIQFVFAETVRLGWLDQQLVFPSGTAWDLFTTYRYHLPSLEHQFKSHGFRVKRDWVSASGEEIIVWIEKS